MIFHMMSIFDPFLSKFIRSQLPDIINKDSTDNIILSASSQDGQSVFLDEGNRTQSDDRFLSSTILLINVAGDTR
ncbi:unnamed protein product [Rotaria magnacalcarata]|uniref:Uncharacterized protein n=2 Tax=Rotaria magnacalcarata TaxID=392030 RepID=A0A817AB32_9BILA|nr:unnamed protein product [Rotaria magnacalcarata]